MLALTIYVFFFLKRYEKKLKAARILSEDKADTSEKTEKPTVLFKPSFKKIDPVDVYWIICLNYVYVQSSYQNTFSYYITTLLIQGITSLPIVDSCHLHQGRWGLRQCTEVRFASLLSGGFTTMAVMNPPESKLAKRTSVHYCALFPFFINRR